MSEQNQCVLIYATYPSLVEAEAAGRAVVSAGLAACVNILPGMVSIYRWQGAVERADEVVMIVKTRASLADRVRVAIKKTHSYDTPAILVLAIDSVDQAYQQWLLAETEHPIGV